MPCFILVQFDVTFPALPCEWISLDAMDISGEMHLDVVSASRGSDGLSRPALPNMYWQSLGTPHLYCDLPLRGRQLSWNVMIKEEIAVLPTPASFGHRQWPALTKHSFRWQHNLNLAISLMHLWPQDHAVFKKRLSSEGQPIDDQVEEHKVGPEEDDRLLHDKAAANNDSSYCGSCYGASQKPEDCCNTCEEVRSGLGALLPIDTSAALCKAHGPNFAKKWHLRQLAIPVPNHQHIRLYRNSVLSTGILHNSHQPCHSLAHTQERSLYMVQPSLASQHWCEACCR